MIIEEQERVLQNNHKKMLISASAGSGKTYIMIKYISHLICDKKIPVKDFLVLTFTKAAATEMKERLANRLKEENADAFVVEQLDSLSVSNISTIHAFCEKCIKKYANLLKINENFTICDENLSQQYKSQAFEKAINELNEENEQCCLNLLNCYKHDKQKIYEIMFEIEALANSVADKKEFFERVTNGCEEAFDKALNILFENFKEFLKASLQEINKLHVDDFELSLKSAFQPIFESKDLYEVGEVLQKFSFPYLPKKKDVGEDVVAILNKIKSQINKQIDNIKKLKLEDQENVDFQKRGRLEKDLLEMYVYFDKEYKERKQKENCLDFYDLENYMQILSEQADLFSGFSYVFVDEYQDTNKAQEKIVKNIAKNCNFVAVGDAKQGIYGFRLASAEIFLKDLEEFQKEENSTVNFLQSNFRSSQKVLDFVNDVFSVCMTKESCGIAYEENSMLKGLSPFEDDGEKAIVIDLVKEKEVEADVLPEVYSVYDAKVTISNESENQLKLLKARINEIMSSQIFDRGTFRRCKYSDIAILSRKRDAFFNQIESYLQDNEIPVISNSRNNLLDEIEIQRFVNFLKVALVNDDEIALASVLVSDLGGFSIEQIAQAKSEQKEKNLCQIVDEDKDGKFAKFNENVQKFRKNWQIFGINKAFLEIFNETNYFAKINLKENYMKLNLFIDKFLQEILSSGFDFDLPALIDYLENVDISVSSESSTIDDAVCLTTIHNSKGLEYPIVILINCDQSLSKVDNKREVQINEELGLAVKFYDEENNAEVVGVKMQAIQLLQKKKQFVEELMIFYVALTRAKNRLYLLGEYKENIFDKFSLGSCDCYYDLIFYALKQHGVKICFDNDVFKTSTMKVSIVDEIEEIFEEEEQDGEQVAVDDETTQSVEEYLNFEYKFDDRLNFKLKETVTSLNKKSLEEVLYTYTNENFNFNERAIEIGNAYHLALKLIDFKNVSDLKSLESQIASISQLSEIKDLIDMNILLNNILILKDITNCGTVFKEKEFIMKEKLCNLIQGCTFDDEILVQGIIDLFVINGDKITLVDYKYSSKDEKYLVEKYKEQLKLYKIALKNAYNLEISKIYLLSLKQNKLIEIENI